MKAIFRLIADGQRKKFGDDDPRAKAFDQAARAIEPDGQIKVEEFVPFLKALLSPRHDQEEIDQAFDDPGHERHAEAVKITDRRKKAGRFFETILGLLGAGEEMVDKAMLALADTDDDGEVDAEEAKAFKKLQDDLEELRRPRQGGRRRAESRG